MRVGRVEEVGTTGAAHVVYTDTASMANDWPNPEAIQSELPPVQAFSEELLPVSFRPLVRDVAERVQVPMDYPAAVTALCLAGAVTIFAPVRPDAKHDRQQKLAKQKRATSQEWPFRPSGCPG